MGLLREPEGRDRAAFAAVRRLLEKGRTWIKLSGTYIRPVAGPDGVMNVGYTADFEPANRVARTLVKAAPERMLWDSDGPHSGLGPTEKPDGAALLDRRGLRPSPPAARRRSAVAAAVTSPVAAARRA